MKPEAIRVFISSTAEDLTEHRQAVSQAIRRLGYAATEMESFGARPKTPLDASLDEVSKADALVVIVAWRYGTIPPDSAEQKSFTWLEVERAMADDIPVFAFLVSSEMPWPHSKEQDDLLSARSRKEIQTVTERVQALSTFKDMLRRCTTVSTFTTAADLAQLVATSLARWHLDTREDQSSISSQARGWSLRRVHPLQPAVHFQGRTGLISKLQSWYRDSGSEHRVYSLVAAGGTGKTAIAESFLRALLEQPLQGGVFVWSFYESTDIERFFAEALRYFTGEDSLPTGLLERLQTTLADETVHLLVLDGLERIQSEGDSGQVRGELLVRSIRLLLRSIADGLGSTLALITSRFSLTDLKPWQDKGYVEHSLEDLETDAAVELLRRWGARGDAVRLGQLANSVGRHALSITVLGSYLGTFAGGDPDRAPNLDLNLAAEDDPQAAKLTRVLAAYADAMSEAEQMLVSLLSSLNRGLTLELLAVVVDSGTLESNPLKELDEEQILRLLERLRRLGIVFSYEQAQVKIWSAHPFLREYFSRSLGIPTDKVHETLRKSVAGSLKDRPSDAPLRRDDINHFAPLIEHTRLSGRITHAVELYRFVLGGYQHLGWVLGELQRGAQILDGLLLSAKDSALPLRWHAWLLADRSLFSLAQGDTEQAAHQCREAIDLLPSEAWEDRFQGLSNGTAISILSGNLRAGLRFALRAQTVAGEAIQRGESLADHKKLEAAVWEAVARHRLGQKQAAEQLFQTAEKLQGRSLLSNAGLRVAEYLADRGHRAEARERCSLILDLSNRLRLHRLAAEAQTVLGRLALPDDPDAACHALTESRRWCDRSGDIELSLRSFHLAGLLHRHEGDLHSAEKETARGYALAQDCGFRLLAAMLKLELARISLRNDEPQRALEHGKAALAIADETGDAWIKTDAEYLLGTAHLNLGRRADGILHLETSRASREELGHPELGRTRLVLADLESTDT